MQFNLFDSATQCNQAIIDQKKPIALSRYKIPIPDGALYYIPNFIDETYIGTISSEISNLDWQQETISIYGKNVKSPRLQCFYGDKQVYYIYSNRKFNAKCWPNCLLELKNFIQNKVTNQLNPSVQFNSVLANLYRNGEDCMGWHADDEVQLGPNPIIASLSIGAERKFQLKHLQTKQRLDINLANGSLLIMAGKMQHFWYHALPRVKGESDARYNFTYRAVNSGE
jgi:alkylated DNA repair dioxygenase AlkB